MDTADSVETSNDFMGYLDINVWGSEVVGNSSELRRRGLEVVRSSWIVAKIEDLDYGIIIKESRVNQFAKFTWEVGAESTGEVEATDRALARSWL
jgi:hypothetical protein